MRLLAHCTAAAHESQLPMAPLGMYEPVPSHQRLGSLVLLSQGP